MSPFTVKKIAFFTIAFLSVQGSALAYTDAYGIPLVRPGDDPDPIIHLDGRGAFLSDGTDDGCCSATLSQDVRLTLKGISDLPDDNGIGMGPILLIPDLDTAGRELSVRVDGNARHPDSNWSFGAALAVNAYRQPNIKIIASGGTLTYWGRMDPESDGSGMESGDSSGAVSPEAFIDSVQMAVNADSRARAALHAAGRMPADVLVLGSTLDVTAQTRISIGATDEEAARGANFTLGSYGAMVVDKGLLYSLESEETEALAPALRAHSGSKLFFAEGSTIVIDWLNSVSSDDSDWSEGEGEDTDVFAARVMTAEDEEPELMPVLIRMAEDSRVEGAFNLTVVDISEETPYEYRLVREDDSWVLGQTVWEAEGPLAAPVNALALQVFEGRASEPLRALFRGTATTRYFSQYVLYSTLMAKSLGTTDAMDALMAGTVRHAVRSALADEWSNPVSIEILGTKRRGRFAVLDFQAEDAFGIARGRRERRASGIALSADTRFGDWFAGARISYEDADVELEFDGLRNSSGLKAESTAAAAGLWLGRFTSWGFVTADAAYSGGEDKLRDAAPQTDTAYPLLIGSERIRRRACSAGVTAALLPETFAGWTPSITTGLSIQYFMPADYSIDGNGTALWQVREKSRILGTASVSAGMTKRWSDEEVKDTVRFTLEGGLRMRAGDLDATQTVSADGVSADIATDDLERGDAFLTADVTGRWKGSVFGIRASGTLGPSGTRSLCGDVHVTYEF